MILGQEQAKRHLNAAEKKVPLFTPGKTVAAPHLCRKGDSYLAYDYKGSLETAGEVVSCM